MRKNLIKEIKGVKALFLLSAVKRIKHYLKKKGFDPFSYDPF